MKLTGILSVAAFAMLFGCAGGEYGITYTTGGEVYDETPPANIETYPYYDYRGSPLYEVNGRYYGRRSNRWYYYNTRPHDLDERYRHERHEEREHEHEHEHEHH